MTIKSVKDNLGNIEIKLRINRSQQGGASGNIDLASTGITLPDEYTIINCIGTTSDVWNNDSTWNTVPCRINSSGTIRVNTSSNIKIYIICGIIKTYSI